MPGKRRGRKSPRIHYPPARSAWLSPLPGQKNPDPDAQPRILRGGSSPRSGAIFFSHRTTLSEFWRFPVVGIDKSLRRRIVMAEPQELFSCRVRTLPCCRSEKGMPVFSTDLSTRMLVVVAVGGNALLQRG